mmetsp:Transcript_35926/g.43379  ORF Transcript_35926/g.43379 Transcript_35926/m.43379 type:complete len:135 (-) Transcript_35926:68-472(-)
MSVFDHPCWRGALCFYADLSHILPRSTYHVHLPRCVKINIHANELPQLYSTQATATPAATPHAGNTIAHATIQVAQDIGHFATQADMQHRCPSSSILTLASTKFLSSNDTTLTVLYWCFMFHHQAPGGIPELAK